MQPLAAGQPEDAAVLPGRRLPIAEDAYRHRTSNVSRTGGCHQPRAESGEVLSRARAAARRRGDRDGEPWRAEAGSLTLQLSDGLHRPLRRWLSNYNVEVRVRLAHHR